MFERQPRRVQELAGEAVAPRVAVLGVAGDRMADRQQVRADLVRPAGLQPSPAAACRSGSARSVSKWVIAWCGSSVSVEMRVRTRRSRPSGASIVPRRAGGRPRPARGTRGDLAGAQRGLQRRVDRSSRASSTSRPDVSRSSRCTTPGRSRSARPRRGPPSACTSVPCSWPRRRVHDDARRLVDHEQVLVLVGDRELARAPRRARRVAALARPHHARPPASDVALGPRHAVDAHAPGVDQPLRRGARAASRGEEDVEPLARRARLGTVSSHGSVGPSSTYSSDQHAERDRRCRRR